MLQIANAFFKLPGDYLKPGEDEVTGMRARLNEILAPNTDYGVAGEAEWEIGDCIAQWWRPNFETFCYPYVPAHIAKPKECKSLYMITLPERSMLILDLHRIIYTEIRLNIFLSQ